MAVLSHLSMGREWQHGQELEDPLASVLQELLLALLGHCGDVFIRTEAGREHASQLHIADPSACNIRVAEDLDWIRAPDRCAMPPSCWTEPGKEWKAKAAVPWQGVS